MDGNFLAINPQDMEELDSHYVRGEQKLMTDPFKCMKWLKMHSYINVIPFQDVIMELNMRLDYLQFIMKRWPNHYNKFSNVHETIKRIGIDIHEACVNTKNEKLDAASSILELVLSSGLNGMALQREVEYAYRCLNYSNIWFEAEDTENNYLFYMGMSFLPQGVKDTKLVAEFVDTLFQKLTYLVSFRLDDMTSQTVKSFEVKLKFLRGFFWFTWTCCIKFHRVEDLFARVRILLDRAACIYYWCYVGKLTPDLEYDVIRTSNCFLAEMKPYETVLRDNYLRALKALQSPPLATHVPHSSKLVVSIADSLVDNFMELDDKWSESEVPTTLRIETISQDLSLLITLLRGLRRECADNIIELKDLSSYVKVQCNEISLNRASASFGLMDKDMLRQVTGLFHQVRGMIKIMEVEFSLIDLQNSISNNSMVYRKGEIEILYEELKSFATLVFNLPGQREWDSNSRHIEALSHIFETVIRSYNMKSLNEDADKKSSSHGLFELSVKVKLIKAEVNLRKLMKNEIIQVDLVKDKIENLLGDLEFLGNLLLDLPEQYDEHERRNDLISSVNPLAGEADSIVESICGKTSDEEVEGKINIQLSDVLQKIKLIKTLDREICPKFPKLSKTNLPRTDGLGFLDFLIGYLVETLESNSYGTFLLKHDIEIVQRELAFLREFLEKFKAQHTEYDELRTLWVQIVGVAYEVEYVVDSYVSNGGGTIWYHMLSDVLEEIRRIKENMTKFSEYGCECTTHSVGDTVFNYSMSQQTEKPKVNEVVVGFEDVLGKLKGKVIGGQSNLDVISIVGMPGLGKTTVAKRLYLDCKATNHFDLCSWCCISQVYERKQVLIEVLQQIIELPDKVEEKSVQDLATLLHKSVIGKRYLIFMDDIWTPDAWDELKSPFKDDNKSSRIILTSRYVEVALYAKCYSEPEHLRWFNEEEGWMLLRQKLFQDQESCPQKFVDVGKQIVKKCHGLPLSVVLVAGFLGKMEMREDKWLQVAESLSSYGIGDSNCRDIIELSYKHLPEYLKPCFLYLGRFMEDEEISVSKLIWLWIAEGLVRKHITKSLEDVAQEYLVNLISRSLLMDAKKRHTGTVKSCRLHDLLHEFCRIKAKEEQFWQDVYSDPNFQDLEQRRISSCSNATFPRYGFPVRSLLIYAANNNEMRPSVPFVLCFRLLKVLDLERIDLRGNFPKEIEVLIHLRYLAVKIGTTYVPRWIDKLTYLETLLIKGSRGEVEIPDTVWNMVRLRHVHINDRASFGYGKEIIDNSSKLHDLETLSTPCLAYGDDTEKMIRKFSNLKRLRCRFLELSVQYSMKLRKKIIRFPTLDFLVHLESLKVFSNGKKLLHPSEFKLPENLKKLTLSNFRLPWKEISTIATLPRLEVLKLLFKAFEGETWQVTDDEFPALKVLKLDNVIISQWDVSDDAFPSLEKLVLQRCKELKEIPSSFSYNTTLESIEVSWCSISITDSAKQIQETQIEELAKDGFKIFI
ncbi:putative late blight resistance protein homolog R1B-16 [Solanum dulcamara]|uniref:putative late blight resistance protein homolog R1B-16 n=1 Tax=Solanum dulcamara TaxID=45834 RepID=UPI002486C3D2|nr:putative late blight resistance protein homolog R1B-16 [Solanum dulcamara]